jgi:hypothetical protein
MWICVLIPSSGCTKQNYVFEDCQTLHWWRNGTQNTSAVVILLLAECPQGCCVEIWQMFTLGISLYCLKAYCRPDHFICIAEQD